MLSERQKEVLRLLLQFRDAKSLACSLDLSVHTVNEHLRAARRVLGVTSSRQGATLLAKAEERSLKPQKGQVGRVVDGDASGH